MDTYSVMREFADSWGMLLIFGVFIFAVFWAMRPGSRKLHDDAAQVPFRYENSPAPDSDVSGPKEGTNE